MDPLNVANLLFTAAISSPDATTASQITELIERDDSPDSGYSQFEEASMLNLPLVSVYEQVLDQLGLGDIEVRPAVWFILFLLADGKHSRIVLYLTVIHALNTRLVTARDFLAKFSVGVPSPQFLDNLYELTRASSGECRLLHTKWRTE